MKQRKHNRPNYRTKTAVNLLLAAVWLFVLWAYNAYPLPRAEWAFRRLERMEQLPQSRIILSTPVDGMLTGTHGEVLQLGNRWFAGLTRDGISLASMDNRTTNNSTLWSYPLRVDGPTPVPLSMGPLDRDRGATGITWENAPDRDLSYYGLSMLLVNAPAETARVEIRIQELYGRESLPPLHWCGEGWALHDGLWLLGLQPEKNYAAHTFSGWYWSVPYELRLYDPEDNLIYERSGTFADDR